ncbi:YcaO-like family protein [Desulfocurvus sp. DL9XJH121]
MRYEFKLEQAAATIGFGACAPAGDLADAQAVAHLEARPMDEYMHRHVLRRVLELGPDASRALGGGPALACVLAEAEFLRPGEGYAPEADPAALAAHSPLVDLRQARLPDQGAHRVWGEVFRANIQEHAPLPAPDQVGAPVPFAPGVLERSACVFADPAEVREGRFPKGAKPVPLAETIRRAQEALERAGASLSQQMRHQMSLSPVGLVRSWEREVRVDCGGLTYSLRGRHDSFGRGLDFDSAQAALLMEICERYSSWADVGPGGPEGLARPAEWVRARFSELGPERALEPSAFPLEAPYADEPLWWLECARPDGSAVLAPAQMIFLFANLDEPALFSGLGSTGLASGNTPSQARLGALMEVLERDAESTAPFDPGRLFRIRSSDKRVADLLARYGRRGLDVLLEDITSPNGLPAYRAFAIGPEGQVAKGASASLKGARAALSAVLEVPYPFPFGPPSLPGREGLPERALEDLPDFSTGSVEGDLVFAEAWLAASGRIPAYADLTRADLGVPVCRALVPGLELMADFDRYSRLSARLFARYLALCGG